MHIVRITTALQTIALKKPFITALRRVESVESLLVTVVSKEGFTGKGEAPPTVAITGESIDSISQTIRTKIAPKLLHVNFTTLEEMLHAVKNSCSKNSSAKAAVDIALYNLFATQKNLPLYRFLGAKQRMLSTYITISLNHPEIMADDAKEAYRNGFHLLKIKVGSNDGKDLQRILHVKQSLPDAKIIIDANQAWSYEQSVAIIHHLKGICIEAIEQPVPAKETEALRNITALSPIPIIADEAVFTYEDAKKIIATKSADIINIKLMKCGGISSALEILALCKAHHIPCMLGSMLEGVTSIEAAMSIAMLHHDIIRYLDLDSPILYKSLPKYSKIICEKNTLSLPHNELSKQSN
jgi:L-alanine-DL-glutamate epimerase-like enolase superfamily enzyme